MDPLDNEKGGTVDVDDSIKVEQSHQDEAARLQEEKALVRRVDLILMPALWFMYLCSYADRTNIGNAKVAGMATALHLSSGQYSLSIIIFFISYIIFEIPSNLILSKTRPSVYLPIIMVLWGVVACCMSAVQSVKSLLAVRFVLGILEAGFPPGVSLLLSTWYKKDEQAKRFSIFYSAAVLSGAFGGIIAGAITGNLNGLHGIAGWRWLFIIEGVATIGVALVAFFLLPDFPATTKRFTQRERQIILDRLLVDHITTTTEDTDPISSIEAVKKSLGNWRTWLLTAGYVTIGGSATLSYFYPTLVAGLGYTSNMAQYMVVPIYSVAFVAVIITGFLNDKFPTYRGAVIASWMTLAMVCSIIVTAVTNFKARYVLLVFMASSLSASNALSLAYAASTFGSMRQETRGVSVAFVNAIAGFAQIYGAYLFPSNDAPLYRMGFGVIAGLTFVGALIYASAHVLIRRYP